MFWTAFPISISFIRKEILDETETLNNQASCQTSNFIGWNSNALKLLRNYRKKNAVKKRLKRKEIGSECGTINPIFMPHKVDFIFKYPEMELKWM